MSQSFEGCPFFVIAGESMAAWQAAVVTRLQYYFFVGPFVTPPTQSQSIVRFKRISKKICSAWYADEGTKTNARPSLTHVALGLGTAETFSRIDPPQVSRGWDSH